MSKIVWIAESKIHPGVYAIDGYDPGQMELTRDISKTMSFKSKADCLEFCDKYPRWQFFPVSASDEVEKEKIDGSVDSSIDESIDEDLDDLDLD